MTPNESRRRDPDLLLAKVQPQERRAARGKTPGRLPAARQPGAHALAACASLAMALAATLLLDWLDLANIAMLFLLVVLLVAVRLGRGPSVTATCVGVACFDYFFVAPRFSLAVSDIQYVVTFGVMLAVGLITGQLTAGLRLQARVAAQRESRTRDLNEFGRALSSVLQAGQVHEMTREAIGRTFDARTALLLPDADGRLRPPLADEQEALPALDIGIAQWAFEHGQCAGFGTDTWSGTPVFYLPLAAPMRTRGVLAIASGAPRWLLVAEERQQLETFAALAAITLERVHYIEVSQDALVRIESERLRNSLLAALSHDLRTPLTSLVALAETLSHSQPPLSQAQSAIVGALREETIRMSTLVTNLLDMARIESGDVKLNRQWQPVEEIVGSALRVSRAALASHRIVTRIPVDLPLVQFDAVLIERVLCNLLENAGKYSPEGSTVTVSAELHGVWLNMTVADNGPGLPAGQEEAVFEKFTRGERESAKPGVGLGLAICRAIMQAHGGTIRAHWPEEGGAAFLFALPLGTPPALPCLDEDMEIEDRE